jgi:tripartite-type tricarboxylate transporter receptor subunit TctC
MTAAMRVAAGVLVAFAAVSAVAQQWPERPLHVIVGYAPGGTGDVFARLVAEKLREPLGQSVVVENHPGASGAIAAGQVAKAAPDGYTLLLGQLPEIGINPSVMKLDYDTTRDLAPIALIGNATLALVVNAESPYHSVQDLIAAARKDPGKLAYATAGTATPGHFAAETLARRANAPMLHAPYKGAGPALTDLLGGHVAFFFSGMPAAMPHVKSGRLRLLAVSTAKRAASAPDTPSVQETVGNFDFSLWGGFFAPAGTSAAIVARLNREVNRVITDPEVRARLVQEGAEVTAYTPEQFAALVRRDREKYARLIAELGIKLE